MKLKQLVNSVESINALVSQKLPVVVSYKLSLFLKKIQPELSTWDEKKDALIKEYGKIKKDEKGVDTTEYEIIKEDVKAFQAKLDTVLEEEIKIDVPEIKINDLGAVEIEPKHLLALDWIIKE